MKASEPHEQLPAGTREMLRPQCLTFTSGRRTLNLITSLTNCRMLAGYEPTDF
jgi:hypothetical protein